MWLGRFGFLMAAALGVSLAQDVRFTDGNFVPAEWRDLVLENPTRTGTYDVMQSTAGGNPDAFRLLHHVLRTDGYLTVGSVKPAATYNPSAAGPISKIDFSCDLWIQTLSGEDEFVYYSLLLFQGDSYYVSRDILIGTQAWQPHSRPGLTAFDFEKLSGTGPRRPDFSAGGGAIQFGYVARSEIGDAPESTTTGIDNWTVSIYRGAPAPTPPSCVVSPRNVFIPGHLPHADGGAHTGHRLNVEVTLDGAPARAVDVTLQASRPAFSSAPSERATLTKLTAKTDELGRAIFTYDPPTPDAFDRTEFTASGTVGGKSFQCQAAVLVGLGTISGPLLGFRTASNAVALVDRNGRQLAWSGQYLRALRKLLLAHPRLLRAQRRKADRQLVQRIMDRPAEGLSVAQLIPVTELAMRLEARSSGELKKSLARVRQLLAPPPAPPERPVRSMPTGSVVQATSQPLGFELNQGQTDSRVRYLARGPGYSFYLTPDGAMLGTTAATVRMQFAGANAAPPMAGIDELPGRSHYLIGHNPARWRLNVPQYGKVRYKNLYPGIDAVFHGRPRGLEFDFVLAPGADPGSIALEFPGIERLELGRSGELNLHHTGASLRLEEPVVYQEVNGVRRRVWGRYVARTPNRVGFQIAGWDRRHPVVIDPVLSFSSYLGGANDEMGMAIAVDGQGNAYVTGTTASTNFPVASAAQPRPGAGSANLDAFVTKLSPDGSGVIYSTYIGGSGLDSGLGIAVDSSGSAYVTGATASSDFPLAQPLQRSFGGGSRAFPTDGFVVKLTPDGSGLVYSTYLGGAEGDTGKSIALDRDGNAYVVGFTASTNFPVKDPLQAKNRGGGPVGVDAFVSKLNAAGTAFVYSTYLGGTNADHALAVAVDAAGNAYVAGVTESTDFPVRNALQSANRGSPDAFLTKLNPSGSDLLFSTYLGGESFDLANALALDKAGNIYLAGSTGSLDFPLVGPAQPKLGAGNLLGADAFVAKLDANGSRLTYSTYLGGKGVDMALALAVGPDGSAYIGGETDSPDFPATGALQSPGAGGNDGFVVKLNPAGSALAYGTTLGGRGHDSITGIALDPAGGLFLTGSSLSGDFPVTAGAYQTTMRGRADALVLKVIEGQAPPRIASVSAASFEAGGSAAPGSIVSGFGQALASRLDGAVSLPLPTVLDGVSVTVKDAAGTQRLAPLFLVSPGQINFLVPENTAIGLCGITAVRGGQVLAAGTLKVEPVAPGLFSANASGRGVAAAGAVRVAGDGTQTGQLVFQCGNTAGSCVPVPIGLESDSVYLTLFGTGIRGRNPGSPLAATVGGEEVPVVYAGAQGEAVGLDQVNVGPLPRTLIGRGEVDVVVTVDGRRANTVTVGIK